MTNETDRWKAIQLSANGEADNIRLLAELVQGLTSTVEVLAFGFGVLAKDRDDEFQTKLRKAMTGELEGRIARAEADGMLDAVAQMRAVQGLMTKWPDIAMGEKVRPALHVVSTSPTPADAGDRRGDHDE